MNCVEGKIISNPSPYVCHWFPHRVFYGTIRLITIFICFQSDDTLSFLFKYPISKLSEAEAYQVKTVSTVFGQLCILLLFFQVEMLIYTLSTHKPTIKASDIFTVGTKLLASVSSTISFNVCHFELLQFSRFLELIWKFLGMHYFSGHFVAMLKTWKDTAVQTFKPTLDFKRHWKRQLHMIVSHQNWWVASLILICTDES